MRSFDREERLRELLTDRAMVGLSRDGDRELRTLDEAGASEDFSFEVAAAALHLALVKDEIVPLPEHFRARLESTLPR